VSSGGSRQNIAIESRFAGAGQDLARQVEQLIVMKVDVIVAMSTPAALATRHMTTSVPVVFSVAGDPVQFGLVATLRRPGGNLTGTYGLTSDHGGKRLALLHEAARHSTRIAVLWTPPDPLLGDEFRTCKRLPVP
jgi:putative ABC transport system substrate-binding protein